jgi:hypothetical protein
VGKPCQNEGPALLAGLIILPVAFSDRKTNQVVEKVTAVIITLHLIRFPLPFAGGFPGLDPLSLHEYETLTQPGARRPHCQYIEGELE